MHVQSIKFITQLHINNTLNKYIGKKARTKFVNIDWKSKTMYLQPSCINKIRREIVSCYVHMYPDIFENAYFSTRLDKICSFSKKSASTRKRIGIVKTMDNVYEQTSHRPLLCMIPKSLEAVT